MNSLFRFPVCSSMMVLFCLTGMTVGQEKKADSPQEKKDPIAVQVAKGNIHFQASGDWKQVKPRSNMLEFEIKVPKIEGDSKDGRLTIMGAGGSIEQNIDRWKGQFTQSDGSSTSDHTKVENKEINGQKVTMVDITGTYIDMPGGPFAGGQKIERPDYRMLAAIIQTKTDGNYFVKLYGPAKTIGKNEKKFKAMIESVNVAE